MFKQTLLAILLAATAVPAAAQDIPIAPLAPLDLGDRADPAAIDLGGIWEYATLNHTGGCPGAPSAGFPMGGLMEITQSGGAIAMRIETGAICDPASMCNFAGTIADGYLVLSNSDIVDDEGGRATNTLQLGFISDSVAQGVGGALYVHPKGMTCGWNWDILMHRPELDEHGNWVPGAAQQGQ
jgi:hypothetical protein